MDKKNTVSEPHLTDMQLKKWVVNSDALLKVCGKGMNYDVMSDKVPIDEFVVAAVQACWSIPPDQRTSLRAEVLGVLKTA